MNEASVRPLAVAVWSRTSLLYRVLTRAQRPAMIVVKHPSGRSHPQIAKQPHRRGVVFVDPGREPARGRMDSGEVFEVVPHQIESNETAPEMGVDRDVIDVDRLFIQRGAVIADRLLRVVTTWASASDCLSKTS